MRKMAFLLSANLILWLAATVFATTWHVGPEGDFQEIQPAIDASFNGDTIIASPGTYVENINFNGKNIVLTSTDPLDPDVVAATIINGNQAGSVVTFDGTEDETCVLSGFTICNGRGTIIPHRYPPPDTICVGGGIIGGDPWGSYTRAAILNNIVTDNSASGQAAVGGGIANCDGLIANNIIARNTAVSSLAGRAQGGGLSHCGGTITNNVIRQNRAARGGGLDNCDGSVHNNVIAGNSAGNDGGGLYFCDGIVVNNTVVGNAAQAGGGGFYICSGTIRNCIVWANTAPDSPQFSYNGSTPTYSCIQNWTGGGIGNIALNPQFVAPGGPDNNPQTFEDNNYRLRSDSPCIDAGQNEDWMWTAFDLDGNPRISNGSVDFGAYEFADKNPPYVERCDPAPGATDVAVNTNVVLHVKDDGNGVDGKTVVLTVNGSRVAPAIYGTQWDYTVAYNPPSDFDYGQTVTITVDATDLCSPAKVMATVTYSFATSEPPDTTPPVIALLGDNPLTLEVGAAYAEPGYTATDNRDGDITANVVAAGSVDHTTLGSYVLRYNVSDLSGNPAEEKTRTVNVVDTTAPEITLLGDNPMTLEFGTAYGEPGCTATDNYDGEITGSVVVTGSVDHTTLGSYVLEYNVSDSSGNPATKKTRTVNVVDTMAPVIALLGDAGITLEVGTPYEEPGCTASDNCDGDLTGNVVITGSVTHDVLGSYVLRYDVSDSSGNPAEEKTRTVNVVDTTCPVIVLLGDEAITLELGTPYDEPGYTATDNYDEDISGDLVVTGSVDHTVEDIYILYYNVSDSSGNPAEEKTRTVEVVRTIPFHIAAVLEPVPGVISLAWMSRPGEMYAVWSCSDLLMGQWIEEATIASGGDTTTWFDENAGGMCKFYRIELK